MPVNHSKAKRVINILFHSGKVHFKLFLLRHVSKDVTSSLISRDKHYNGVMVLKPQIFFIIANKKCMLHFINKHNKILEF